jgi:hypothetical protein
MAITKRRKGAMVAGLLGVVAFGGAFASAAGLGITDGSLGAGVTLVASCDTDGVTLGYTTAYDATSGTYKTATVNVTGIAAACAGKKLDITVKNAAGTSLGTGSVASIVGTSASVTLAADAASVAGAAVVIYG